METRFRIFLVSFFFFLKLNSEINIREKLIKGGEIYKKSNNRYNSLWNKIYGYLAKKNKKKTS